MKDQEGRTIEYLRLSVTERCQLRCTYCKAASGECPKEKELTLKEISRIISAMSAIGVRKVRLTGGEPLLRRDIADIVAAAKAQPGIEEVAMTTNAQLLEPLVPALKQAGLDRLNISIDSLHEARYRELTGGGDIQAVLHGIDAAVEAGLLPVKLNAVVMRGKNDDEIDDFIALTKNRDIDMRFIELMPMGTSGDVSARIPSAELIAARPWLVPIAPRYEAQPSEDFRVQGHIGRVGFISPISHRFCGACNRVRVMSDGMLRPCLGNNMEVSLKEALFESTDELLRRQIKDAVFHKPHAHTFEQDFHTERDMSRIGG